jgi:lipopolysaccharide transport system ATP-binding protein
MSDVVIRCENLEKLYRIGKRESYKTLRDTLTESLSSPFRRLRSFWQPENPGPLASSDNNHIWALKDLSLDIKRGDVVGIIGRNGAGKTTLLKILSRITEPTAGQAKIRGRVGSLLEVGTGFHPELTGRENIYLNAAILGMKKTEINRKFDEVVAFAETENFLDTPLKHYSSGMYVRLAFAVAAHLDPDILLVDEVLAVGDAAFQKKCLGKMGDIAQEGRTVLFVSHNMGSVNQLCSRAIMFDKGKLTEDGECHYVIERYLNTCSSVSAMIESPESDSLARSGTGAGRIIKVELEGKNGSKTDTIGIGEPLNIRIHVKLILELASLVAGVEIKSQNGIPVLNLRSDYQGEYFGPFEQNSNVLFTLKIPSFPFYPGIYKIEPWFAEKKGKRIDHIHEGISIKLEPVGNFKSETIIQKERGLVIMDIESSAEVMGK